MSSVTVNEMVHSLPSLYVVIMQSSAAELSPSYWYLVTGMEQELVRC